MSDYVTLVAETHVSGPYPTSLPTVLEVPMPVEARPGDLIVFLCGNCDVNGYWARVYCPSPLPVTFPVHFYQAMEAGTPYPYPPPTWWNWGTFQGDWSFSLYVYRLPTPGSWIIERAYYASRSSPGGFSIDLHSVSEAMWQSTAMGIIIGTAVVDATRRYSVMPQNGIPETIAPTPVITGPSWETEYAKNCEKQGSQIDIDWYSGYMPSYPTQCISSSKAVNNLFAVEQFESDGLHVHPISFGESVSYPPIDPPLPETPFPPTYTYQHTAEATLSYYIVYNPLWKRAGGVWCMQTPLGRFHTADVSAGQVVYRRSDLTRPPFASEATVATGSRPRMIEDLNLRLHLIYEASGNVYITHSDDDGATWSTGMAEFAGGTYPTIAVNPHTGAVATAAIVSGAIKGRWRSHPNESPSDFSFLNDSGSPMLTDGAFHIAASVEGPQRWMLTVKITGETAISYWESCDDCRTWRRIT